jgi:flavodoxin I
MAFYVHMKGIAMNALVVYDSLYGNTEKIAQTVAAVLDTFGPTRIQPVADVSSIPPDTDLLVIGGPTHGHAVNAGITSFLERLETSAVSGIAVTAFDTRVDWPVLLSGSAAKGIGKQLRRKGGNLIVEPGSFLVDSREGPLKDGELERAASWAQQIVNAVRAQ